jgi:hypothetical protein
MVYVKPKRDAGTTLPAISWGPEPHIQMSETGSARSALSRIAGIKALSGVTPNAQSGALKLVGIEFEAGNG